MLASNFQTRGPNPRFLYILGAVDSATGERRIWERLSVDGKEDGLRRLWEAHAERVLEAMLKVGRVPGSVHVRSSRVARFLRPLGLQLPFKLVQHLQLPRLDTVLRESLQVGRV